MGHEAGEADEVQAVHGLRQSLVVADEAAEARGPGERALNDPAPGQQDEALPGLGQLDDLELDAVLGGGLGGLLAAIALVGEGDLDATSPVTSWTASPFRRGMQPWPIDDAHVFHHWRALNVSGPVDAQPEAEFLLVEGWMLGAAMYEAAMSEVMRVPPAKDA